MENTAQAIPVASPAKPNIYKAILIIFTLIILILITLLVLLYLYTSNLQNAHPGSDNTEVEDNNKSCPTGTPTAECPECVSDCPDQSCVSEFNNEETIMLEDWIKHENELSGYSFRYPGDWIITDDVSNVGIKDAAMATLSINFYSGAATERDILIPMVTEKEGTMEIGCIEAHKTESRGDGSVDPAYTYAKFVVITFENNSTPYRIEITYKDMGASITGDIIDMYSLILKTFRFM